MDFVHLHCHSNYSLLLGASSVSDLLMRAKELGMSHLALTDTNNLYGAFEFCQLAEAIGVEPIVGAQVEFLDGDVVLLVVDDEGYGNLCEMLTRRNLDGAQDACECLSTYHRGLIVLARDVELARLLQSIIPAGDLYLEVPIEECAGRDSQPGKGASMAQPLAACCQIAKQYGGTSHKNSGGAWGHAMAVPAFIPRVATGPVFFAASCDYERHRVLTAIRLNKPIKHLSESDVVSKACWLRSKEEMCRIFGDDSDAILNTVKVAERCKFRLKARPPMLPEFALPEGEASAEEFLEKICRRNLKALYPNADKRRVEQLDNELQVIGEMGMAAYFLIVWDIANFARRRGIPMWGRGSAANSLVSHLLGLTQPDPLRYNLYFPRFLSRGRKGCPDVDLDFCHRRRDEVLKYVLEKYGEEHAALLSTHVTFGARFALREVGRVLGLSQNDLNALTRGVPHFGGCGRAVSEPSSGRARRPYAPRSESIYGSGGSPLQKVVAMAERIRGFPRHLSVHPGGTLISRGKLNRYVPLERSSQGLPVTQFEMNAAEATGLVKIDLLGQRGLSVIADTLKAIRANYGTELELDKIDRKDPKTLRLLAEGRTIGCFQIESPSMRNLLQRLRPKSEDDVIVAIALVRPGPREGGMLDRFIRRFHGKERVSYLHPALEPILKESFGILMTEEQVMRIAVEVVGLTDAEAHVMRKMITKGRRYPMTRQIEVRFKECAVKRGFRPELADKLWELVSRFASFSFCKAHAVSYGLLSYRCAFLKAHFTAEFLAAVLSNHGGYYDTREYVQETKRCGLAVQLPCINRSEADFTGNRDAIRIGLSQIGGLKQKTISRILSSRDAGGEFPNLADFVFRVKPSYQELESLIRCGAVDCFGLTRPQLLWQMMRLYPALKREKQQTLLSGIDVPPSPPVPPQLPRYTWQEIEKMEIEILGVDPRDHGVWRRPLPGSARVGSNAQGSPRPGSLGIRAAALRQAERHGFVKSSQLAKYRNRRVAVSGRVIAGKRIRTRKGNYMKFLTLEDSDGLVEVVLFPSIYQKFGSKTVGASMVQVKGIVRDEGGSLMLNAEQIT